MAEEEIEQAFAQGDEGALEQIIDKYTPLVVTLIRNISQNRLSPQDVEETAADSFTALWQLRDRILPGRLRGYLCGLVKYRTKLRLRSLRDTDELEEAEDLKAQGEIYDSIENRELQEKLNDALMKLDETDRAIVVRHYYYYQTTKQIAEQMDMKTKTVQTRLIRARDKLKKLLEEMGVKP